jgi:hypothetical protein
MKPVLPRALAILLSLFASAAVVFAGPFHTKIITSGSEPVVLILAQNVFLQVKNFTQEGGTTRGTVAVTVDGQTANVLTASQINATSVAVVPEIINRIVIAGPATVTINPVADATLTITYRKLREGAPITPTPAATPTPTATPTATPTPTP